MADKAEMTRARRRHVQRDRLATELSQCGRGGFEKFCAPANLERCHPDRLADVRANRYGDIVGCFQQGFCRCPEPTDPDVGGLLAMPGKGKARRLDRDIDAVTPRLRNPADDLAVVRRDKIEKRLSAFEGLPVDEARILAASSW
jgi:hypothetical protein